MKLYDEEDYNLDESFSPELRAIISEAHEQGYRMIEFDSDAAIYDIPTFEHYG